MGLSHDKCGIAVLLVCLSILGTFSDGVFGSQVLGERRLLQEKQTCPIDFERQNYTILTSQCKGPKYEPDLCCPAYKQIACPFVNELNNRTTNCAERMDSYISLYFTKGLFASLCREVKEGLICLVPAPPPTSASPSRKLKPPPQAAAVLLFLWRCWL